MSVNGKTAKAGLDIKPGDVIEIAFGTNTSKYEVLSVADNVRKENAGEMYRSL